MSRRDERKWERGTLAEACWREWQRVHPPVEADYTEREARLFKSGWASGRRTVIGLASLSLVAAFVSCACCIVIAVLW